MARSPTSPGPAGAPRSSRTRISYSGAARPIRTVGQPDEAMTDGLGHAPPADRLHAEHRVSRRRTIGVAPQTEMVSLRNDHGFQRLRAERNHRGPGAAMF